MRFVHEHSDRELRSYAPSFFDGAFLTETHGGLVAAVEHVRGKLEVADHLKLYEVAYFADGRVLEIGRLAGKSTVCLALGARDGNGQPIYSIDYDPKYTQPAVDALREFGVEDRVTVVTGDSAVQARRLPSPFAAIFVDGDHTYDGVRRDIEAIHDLLGPDGVLLFHDYFHKANETGDYGVKRAVDEGASAYGWLYRGRFGGIALFAV